MGCICYPGYNGTNCENLIDPCTNINLPLNSICTSVGVTPVFTCKTGYARNDTTNNNCYGNLINNIIYLKASWN